MNRVRTLNVLLWTAVALSAWQTPARAETESAENAVLKQVGFVQNLGTTIPLNLPFRNEQGAPVTLRQYFGHKPVLLNLVYFRCPMLCTEVLNGIIRTMKVMPLKLAKDYDVLTISIDPTETPKMAALKKSAYMDRYGHLETASGWNFLTGEQASIKALADAVGFHYAYDPQIKQFAHASGIMILTPEGKISHYFFGVEYPVQDVRLSLVEAGHGRTGTVTDQLLLYCYHYDPESGRYGIAIMRVLRIAALCTIVSLGSFIALALRREKHLNAA